MHRKLIVVGLVAGLLLVGVLVPAAWADDHGAILDIQ